MSTDPIIPARGCMKTDDVVLLVRHLRLMPSLHADPHGASQLLIRQRR